MPLPKKPNVHEILTAFFEEATSIRDATPLDVVGKAETHLNSARINVMLSEWFYAHVQYLHRFGVALSLRKTAVRAGLQSTA